MELKSLKTTFQARLLHVTELSASLIFSFLLEQTNLNKSQELLSLINAAETTLNVFSGGVVH